MEKVQNIDTEEHEEKPPIEQEVISFGFQRRSKRKISRVSLRNISHHQILNKLSRTVRKTRTLHKIPTAKDHLTIPRNDISSYHYRKFSNHSFNNSSRENIESISEIVIDDEPLNDVSLRPSGTLTSQVKVNEKKEIPRKNSENIFLKKKTKKKKLFLEEENLNSPKILINSRTMKESDLKIDENKDKRFRLMYEKYEKNSERRLLNPDDDRENCEIRSRDGSERAIVGEVRTGNIKSGLSSLRIEKSSQNKNTTGTGSGLSNNLKKIGE